MDDSKIKNALDEAVKDISPSEDLLYSIKNLSVREDIKMKKARPVKLILTCALILGVFTVGAIGAGKIASVESHSSLLEEVTHFPSKDEVKQMAGFVPAYAERLGKFVFKSCVPVHSSDIDEAGNNLGDHTGINFTYKTDKGILSLSADPKPLRIEKYTERSEHNGTDIYYHKIAYKFVPPDYELTDEDKALKEMDKLEISYGSDKVETMDTQSLIWERGGITYCLLDMDVQIDKTDFEKMAYQLIDTE